MIHEYGKNNTDASWDHMAELGTAMLNSSIAATVTYSPWSFDKRVHYLMQGNFIQEKITRQATGTASNRWDGQEEVSLTASNAQVHESGSLAVLWFRQVSPRVEHSYALFPSPNGDLTLLSGGSEGWIPQDVPFNSAADTPIVMIQSWPVSANNTRLTMFYREDKTDNIPGLWGTEEKEWEDLSVPCPAHSADPNTSIVSFVFDAGDREIMVLLISNADGVRSYTPTRGESTWRSDKPESMGSLDRSSPLAATQDGRAFGIEKGVIKEFRFGLDGSWSSTGNILKLQYYIFNTTEQVVIYTDARRLVHNT